MAGLNEVTGLQLIERISRENFEKGRSTKRIWSEQLNCWGFFGPEPNNVDKINIIGCAKIGDLILPDGGMIWKPMGKGEWEPFRTIPPASMGFGIVFDKSIIDKNGSPFVKLSFLLGGEQTGVFDVLISLSDVYKVMWGMVGT